MLDTRLLDELGRPGVVMRDGKALLLHDVFAHVASGGWHPRNPAYGDELTLLETSTARGNCLEPLICDGDVLYIDQSAQALPGDIVSFQLSARGAEVQNAGLPPGQSPWKRGDRWCKLYVPYHGLDMLLEKYGSSATASLLGGEHPEAHVPLHPIRNIRRDGRLLFTPECACPEIGLNAATSIIEASVSSATTSVHPTGGVDNIMSVTVGPYPVDVTLVLTVSGTWQLNNTSGSDVIRTLAYAITTSSSVASNAIEIDAQVPAGIQINGVIAGEITAALLAGSTATYYLNSTVLPSSGAPPNTFTLSNVILKSESVKR